MSVVIFYDPLRTLRVLRGENNGLQTIKVCFTEKNLIYQLNFFTGFL